MSCEDGPAPAASTGDAASPALERFSLYEISVAAAYAAYERFRTLYAVAHSESFGGHFILTRHRDVKSAARDWQRFSSAQGVDLPKNATRTTVIASDPPLHDELRALDQEVLNPKTIEALRPYVVSQAHRLVDGFAATGSCDLVADFCEQLPPALICRIVGLDEDLAFEMRQVSIALGDSFDDPERHAAALEEFRGFVLPQIEKRRASPRDDFLTRLANEPFRGAPIEDESIVQTMIGFLLAGHESTTAAMSSLFFHLLSRRELASAVVADDRLLSAAIEETLRLDTPFHQFRRTTTCPVEIDENELPAGSDVLVNYAAANRDPAVFERPDEFLLGRRRNPHLAFGFGVHTCVGAPLARMELRVAVPELLRRLPDLELAVDAAEVEWEFLGGNLAFIRSLPARFTAERGRRQVSRHVAGRRLPPT